MKLVLLRHAQKGITPFDDPHLTETGFRQSEALASFVEKKILPIPTHAWVSPKIRTAQTLKSVCELAGARIEVTKGLDLRSADESANVFRKRVQQTLQHFQDRVASGAQETHYLCTHYDWIEDAMTLIHSDKDLNSFEFSHWGPTQYIVFEIQDDIWKVFQKGSAHATKTD